MIYFILKMQYFLIIMEMQLFIFSNSGIHFSSFMKVRSVEIVKTQLINEKDDTTNSHIRAMEIKESILIDEAEISNASETNLILDTNKLTISNSFIQGE
jgi:hypothetical protein